MMEKLLDKLMYRYQALDIGTCNMDGIKKLKFREYFYFLVEYLIKLLYVLTRKEES